MGATMLFLSSRRRSLSYCEEPDPPARTTNFAKRTHRPRLTTVDTGLPQLTPVDLIVDFAKRTHRAASPTSQHRFSIFTRCPLHLPFAREFKSIMPVPTTPATTATAIKMRGVSRVFAGGVEAVR